MTPTSESSAQPSSSEQSAITSRSSRSVCDREVRDQKTARTGRGRSPKARLMGQQYVDQLPGTMGSLSRADDI